MSEPVLGRAAVARRIEAATFARSGTGPARIGVEAELIPFDLETGRVASIAGRTLPILHDHARTMGWATLSSTKGAPRFAVPGGGSITFEPGGQIEYATAPFEAPSDLLAHLRSIIDPLCDATRDAGIELAGVGIDPRNTLADTPLQIDADRYTCMDAYFASSGGPGARMMRQTASIQVNVDAGEAPALTWKVLNALAPVLTATFANSRRYAGEDTGLASYRAETWRLLDPGRTGLAWREGNPADGYTEFALAANAMFVRSPEGEYLPFRDWVERGTATPERVDTHLSTLFPEVRPRRWFEIRSIDALAPGWYAAPVLMIAGLILDPDALHAAAAVLGTPDPGLLGRAAAAGLRDPELARRARTLTEIALDACGRMNGSCSPADLDRAKGFFESYTWRARSPGDGSGDDVSIATAA